MATKKTKTEDVIEAGETNANTVDVSRETLDKTPSRLLDFLKAAGTREPIRASLYAVGYTEDEHQRGWKLLHNCAGFRVVKTVEVNQDALGAIGSLDKQDERTHTIIDASLKHKAPKARAYLLDGIDPGTGADSVLYFDTLVPRMDTLAAGKAPKVPAAEQKLANEVLEKRGFGAAKRAELTKLLATAKKLSGEGGASADAAAEREALDEHLRAARAFYEEWAAIARSEIKRRDHLILMGLASRRSRAAAKDEPEDGDDAGPAPAAP
jgi:hypothetical protein